MSSDIMGPPSPGRIVRPEAGGCTRRTDLALAKVIGRSGWLRWLRLALALSAAFVSLAVGHAVAGPDEPPLVLWDLAARVLAGAGYRDNGLLTSIQSESSAFVELNADLSAIRLSESGASLSLFILGEFRRFLETIEADGQPYEHEQLLYVTSEWAQPLDEQNTLRLGLQYFYQYQVIDASVTEAALRRVLIKGHALSFTPEWGHQFSDAWAVSLDGLAERQIYEADLDDYWQGAARVKLTRAYGNKSEASFGYHLRHRFYDSREQYTREGMPIPGSELVYRIHELGGEWRHHWDKARHWRTTLKAGYLISEDNGSGYFDYDRVQVSAKARWRQAGWEVTLGGRAGWYYYDVEQVAGENRRRAYYAVDARVERQLSKHWLAYAAASREWNVSNDPLDEYDDWMASAGVGVEF